MSRSVAVRVCRTSCSQTTPSRSCQAPSVKITAHTHILFEKKSIMKHLNSLLAIANVCFNPAYNPVLFLSNFFFFRLVKIHFYNTETPSTGCNYCFSSQINVTVLHRAAVPQDVESKLCHNCGCNTEKHSQISITALSYSYIFVLRYFRVIIFMDETYKHICVKL